MMEHKNDPNESAGKLRNRIFYYTVSALSILLLGLMLIISFTLFDHLKKAESHNIAHIAEIRSIAVSEWCQRAKDVARQITSRTRIRQELEKYNDGEISLKQLREFVEPKLRDAMDLSNDVIGIIRLDKNNNIVARCGMNLSLADHEIVDYISDDVFISVPLMVGDRQVVLVSTPILKA